MMRSAIVVREEWVCGGGESERYVVRLVVERALCGEVGGRANESCTMVTE